MPNEYNRRHDWPEDDKEATLYLTPKLRIRLTDSNLNPLPGAKCRLREDQENVLECDDDGVVEIPAERCRGQTIDLEWEQRDAEEVDPKRRFYWSGTFSNTIASADEEFCSQRLAHLGFTGKDITEQVNAYQDHFGQEPNGALKDIREELVDWHDGGNYPSSLVAQGDGNAETMSGGSSTAPAPFNYKIEGAFPSDFVAKLIRAHSVAYDFVCAALKMMSRKSTDDTREMLRYFFGKDANEDLKFLAIKDNFMFLESGLKEKFSYIGQVCGDSGDCSGGPGVRDGRRAHTTKVDGDIIVCFERLKKFTDEGVAALLIHENVHRSLGFWGDDICHVDNNTLIRLDQDGECDINVKSGSHSFERWPADKLVKNCNSYACVGAWSYHNGFAS